jgi:hypothetical protein
MDISSVTPCPSPVLLLVTLFCFVWPFLAMAAVSRRGRSSAPIAAALVALAVILCGIWLDLSNLVGAMAITGVGRETMVTAARDTFETGAALAMWPIGWILILSLVLRHRPIVDRVVIALSVLLCASAVTAWSFVTFLEPSAGYVLFARVAAAATLAIAIWAAVRLFVVTRPVSRGAASVFSVSRW